MMAEDGAPSQRIWLVGDSNPSKWEDFLEYPFDARHPARHSIWTPIWDTMQDVVYRQGRQRIDKDRIYIRNAVENAALKPLANATQWSETLSEKVDELQQMIHKYRPRLILSFGSFSFEFCRRGIREEGWQSFRYWNTERMGKEFSRRIGSDLGGDSTLLLPLLHASIARGKFIASHNAYCGKAGGNYFNEVGKRLGDWFLQNGDPLNLWLSMER